ncbi:MAG: LysR family transcriptional regulator [Desulfobacteraceae bacterium IS3]|nr:MAG: LysR family transcriptional regulator [Desulfobacteraceae bacterium IS3]
MDLWQLNIFCKVVELKSFSKAADAIHLSQPTISSHIKDLENHFGCRLIDRLSKEAIPTKAGELLYDYARRLLSLRDETETALAEFHGKIKGHLVIGGSTIPGVYILPRAVGDFINNYPDVTVSIIIGDTEKIIQDTLSGVLELGVVGAGTVDKRVSQEKLIEDEMSVIVPESHRWAKRKSITADMLMREPFIIRERGSGTLKSIQNSLSRSGYSIADLRVVAEMGSTEAVIQGIKNKVGVSCLSCIAVSDELKTGTLKALTVESLDLRRCFYLTRSEYRSASPLCRAFISFLKKMFPTA